jgi:hypothetical protein
MSALKVSRKFRSAAQNELGSAEIEFAFALPVLCILTLGMSDIGLYFFRSAQLDASLEAGVLYATSYIAPTGYGWHSSKPNSAADITTVVQNSVGGNSITMVSTPSCDYRCTVGSQIQSPIIACVDRNGNANNPVLCADGDYSGQYVTISAQKSGGDTFLSSTLLNLSNFNLYPIQQSVIVRVR